MRKKKYLIFFVMLLVELLVGLSASCYAFSLNSYNDFVNWVDEVSSDALEYYSDIDFGLIESGKAVAACSDFQNLNISWASYDNFFFRHYVSSNDSTSRGWILYCFNGITEYIVNNDGRIILNGEISIPCDAYYFRYTSHGNGEYTCWYYYYNEVTYSNSSPPFQINHGNNLTFVGTDNDIINNSEYPVFGPIVQPVFKFEEVSSTSHVKIGSDGVSMPLYYAPGSSLYFADFINDNGSGQINLDKLITGDALYMTYYIGNGSWAGRVKFFEREFGSNTFTDNRYINYTKSSITDTKFALNGTYIYTNVVYDYQIFYSEDGISKFLNYYFYVGDSTTTIVDNIIDPGDSIPDLNNYLNTIGRLTDTINNNDNNDNIVDTISSGDNAIIDTILGTDGVEDTLHELASGDVESTAFKLGFQNLANPYSIVIFGFVNDVIETLQGSGDVYFDYSMHGESPTRIHSSDIYLPNGKLKTFIRLVLIFITIYFIYNRFRILVDQLSTADVKGTIENTDVDVNYFYM